MITVHLRSEALHDDTNAPWHFANQWHILDGSYVPHKPLLYLYWVKPLTLEFLNPAGAVWVG